MLLRLRQVRGAGEHPGDLVHALLALDGPYQGLAALAVDEDVAVAQSCNRGLVGDQDDLGTPRELLELLPREHRSAPAQSGLHLVEDERWGQPRVGERQLERQEQPAQLPAGGDLLDAPRALPRAEEELGLVGPAPAQLVQRLEADGEHDSLHPQVGKKAVDLSLQLGRGASAPLPQGQGQGAGPDLELPGPLCGLLELRVAGLQPFEALRGVPAPGQQLLLGPGPGQALEPADGPKPGLQRLPLLRLVRARVQNAADGLGDVREGLRALREDAAPLVTLGLWQDLQQGLREVPQLVQQALFGEPTGEAVQVPSRPVLKGQAAAERSQPLLEAALEPGLRPHPSDQRQDLVGVGVAALDLGPPLVHRPQVPVAGARPVEYGVKLLGRRSGPGIGAGVHHGELPADVQKLHLRELALNAKQNARSLSAGPQGDREPLEGATGTVPARQDAPHEEGPILRLEGVVQVGEAGVGPERRLDAGLVLPSADQRGLAARAGGQLQGADDAALARPALAGDDGQPPDQGEDGMADAPDVPEGEALQHGGPIPFRAPAGSVPSPASPGPGRGRCVRAWLWCGRTCPAPARRPPGPRGGPRSPAGRPGSG